MSRIVGEERSKRNRQIAKAIKQGRDFLEIAQEFNLSVAMIRFMARDWRLVRNPATKQISSIIIDFYSGMDEKALAKKYRRNRYYLARLLKQSIPDYVPLKQRLIPLRNQKVIEQYQMGSPIQEIAADSGLGEAMIKRILNDAGVLKKKFTRRKRSSRA